MKDTEYTKALEYLDNFELEEGEYYGDGEYIEAVSSIFADEILEKYMSKKKVDYDDYHARLDNALDDFFARLNAKDSNDPRFQAAKRTVNGEVVNAYGVNMSSRAKSDAISELVEPANLKKKAVAFFNGKLEKGEPIPEEMKERFFEMPIQDIAYHTGDVFKGIFGVEKTDEQLETLKKEDPAAYETERKGKTELNEETLKTSLDAYKTMNDKAKKTGFFDMLFHLPSFLKLRNNTKKLAEQLKSKGVNGKTIDEYAKGQLSAHDAFAKNKLNNGEINEEQYAKEIAPKSKEKETKSVNRFEKALEQSETGEKSKEDFNTRMDATLKRMNDGLRKAQSKKGGQSSKQAKISRWTESYKRAAAALVEYNKTKQEKADNYRKHFTDQMEQLDKRIKETARLANSDYDSLSNQYGMDINDIRKWSSLDKNGVNSKGNPFTEQEKEIIDRCNRYIDLRRAVSEDQKTLQNLGDEKKVVDKMIAEREFKHQKDIKDFNHYKGRLVKAGVLSDETLDEQQLKTQVMLNQKLDVINDNEEDEYEEEEELLENNDAQKEDEMDEDEIDYDKLATDSDVGTKKNDEKTPFAKTNDLTLNQSRDTIENP